MAGDETAVAPAFSPLPASRYADAETQNFSGEIGPHVVVGVGNDQAGFESVFDRTPAQTVISVHLDKAPLISYGIKIYANGSDDPVMSVDFTDRTEWAITLTNFTSPYRLEIQPYSFETGFKWAAAVTQFHALPGG